MPVAPRITRASEVRAAPRRELRNARWQDEHPPQGSDRLINKCVN
jgi:hypothetical protein